MTFQELFLNFQKKYGNNHDIIFFELVFYCSKTIKSKDSFVTNRNNEIDFKSRKFEKLCNDYFVKLKPLAHITGQAKFCGLNFIVSKKVLSPRDVTEQMTKDFIAKHKNSRSARLLDLCCGCGCIGISVKKYLPQMIVTCIDKYWGPVFDTYENAKRNKTKLTIDCKDAINYLNHISSIDYMVSNPPYINIDNFENAKKMMKWESKKALIASENGLYFYKKYFEWLNKHTFIEVWLEYGYDLTQSLKDLAKQYPDLTVNFETGGQYLIITRK